MDGTPTTMGPGPHRLAGSGAGTRRTRLPRIASLAFPAGGVPGAAPAGRGREPLRAAHAAGEPGTGIRGGARLLGAALAGIAIVVSAGSASAADPPNPRNAAAALVEASRPDDAAVARHVADALATEPGTLDEWEQARWSPGIEADPYWIDRRDPLLRLQVTAAYRQAYEDGIGPKRAAAARRFADAIAATFAVRTGIEPAAASFLCANRKRNPTDGLLNSLFGGQPDPAAERRRLDAIRARATVGPGEAAALIDGTCRTLHDDTVAARVALAAEAAGVQRTFGADDELAVPSHADGRLVAVDPTGLVEAAATDGIQVTYRPGGSSGAAMGVTPFGRGSPRLTGKLGKVANADGTTTLVIAPLENLPGLKSPEETISCLATPLEQARAEAKAKQIGGVGVAMFGGYPEDGGRAVADAFRLTAALDRCEAAKSAFLGQAAR